MKFMNIQVEVEIRNFFRKKLQRPQIKWPGYAYEDIYVYVRTLTEVYVYVCVIDICTCICIPTEVYTYVCLIDYI